MDSSVLEIGQSLEDAEIIENKYVFFAKVKIKNSAAKIQAGQYGLSAGMNMEEILTIICHLETEEKEN